jgi:hypothetical protein
MTTRAVRRVLLLLLLGVWSGCRPDPSTARGTAERFLDAHYVRIDLPEALPYTTGLARRKVEDEIGLTQGQKIDETTRKPTVHYTFLEEHGDGSEGVNLVYRGTIDVEDAERFQRRWLVTVRREDAGWRVSNWQELAE